MLFRSDTMLVLLGDYIHGGADNYGVLDRIMELQYQYGSEKIKALMGNHEDFVLLGFSTINDMMRTLEEEQGTDGEDDKNMRWMEQLPRVPLLYRRNGTGQWKDSCSHG